MNKDIKWNKIIQRRYISTEREYFSHEGNIKWDFNNDVVPLTKRRNMPHNSNSYEFIVGLPRFNVTYAWNGDGN